jgi:hypothetical protein
MSTRTTGPSGADPRDIESCPKCGETSGVKVVPDTPPKVWAWSCGDCGTQWWITIVNPHPRRVFLDQRAMDVVAWSVLHEVTTLAEQVDTLTKGQLLARLLNCWGWLAQVCRDGAAASVTPAGYRPDNEVPSAPPVPRTPR